MAYASCTTSSDIGDEVGDRDGISMRYGDEVGVELRLLFADDVSDIGEFGQRIGSAVVDCSGGTRLFSPPPPVVRML